MAMFACDLNAMAMTAAAESGHYDEPVDQQQQAEDDEPQQEEEDSLVDPEGNPWTRDRWLAAYEWMSDAAKDEECTKRGWRPFTRAAKQPMRSPFPPEEPDLADYFDSFETPKPTQIAICRAYANYLAAGQPKKPSQKKRAKKE